MEDTAGFFPEGYAVPTSGGSYMRFTDGENHFRILSAPTFGFEYWTTDNKPIRSKEEFTDTPNIKLDKDGKPTRINHFWAMTVWNYKTKKVELLQITQKTVQNAILALSHDVDWGTPTTYDLKVSRSGSGFDTEYSVTPRPKNEVTPEIMAALEKSKINFEAMFTGENPFS